MFMSLFQQTFAMQAEVQRIGYHVGFLERHMIGAFLYNHSQRDGLQCENGKS